MPRNDAYAASKGAVTALVRSLAIQLARDDITVNAILPGWVRTAMTDELLASEVATRKIMPRIPMRRWGGAEDFESIAVLLAGSGARYLTGQTIVVDGGYSIY
jgi:NAD(P)-dependent dehydrogenase (short-subunit alcohol dehydrogenase family)